MECVIIAIKGREVKILRKGDVEMIAQAMAAEAYKPLEPEWAVMAMSYNRYLQLKEESDASRPTAGG